MLLLVIYLLPACETKTRTRPIGWFKLGKVEELLAEQHLFKEYSLLLRRDERGFSVMSTMCTHDLSPLTLQPAGEEMIFVSQYSESKYDAFGHVLSGPAISDLPFYELKIDTGAYDGPRDTLYAQVGVEVGRAWRLRPPPAIKPANEPQVPVQPQ